MVSSYLQTLLSLSSDSSDLTYLPTTPYYLSFLPGRSVEHMLDITATSDSVNSEFHWQNNPHDSIKPAVAPILSMSTFHTPHLRDSSMSLEDHNSPSMNLSLPSKPFPMYFQRKGERERDEGVPDTFLNKFRRFAAYLL